MFDHILRVLNQFIGDLLEDQRRLVEDKERLKARVRELEAQIVTYTPSDA